MENIKSIEPTCKTIKFEESTWDRLLKSVIRNFDSGQNNYKRVPKINTVSSFVLFMKDALYHTKSNCEEPSLQEVQEEMYLEAVFAIHKVLGISKPINKEDNLGEIFKGREKVWKYFRRELSYSIEPVYDKRFGIFWNTIVLIWMFIPISAGLSVLWVGIGILMFGGDDVLWTGNSFKLRDDLLTYNAFVVINIIHGIIISTFWLAGIYQAYKKGWRIIPYDTIEELCDSVVANHLPIYGKYLTEEEIVKMSKILLKEYSNNIWNIKEIGLASRIYINPTTPM